MNSNKEILAVIQQVEKGKISTQEGEQKISQLQEKSNVSNPSTRGILNIHVDTKDLSEKSSVKINIDLPLKIIKKVLQFTKFLPYRVKQELADEGIDLEAMDLGELIDLLINIENQEEIITVDTFSENEKTKVNIGIL